VGYRLEAREPLPDGVRRIVAEQLIEAEAGLRSASGDNRDAGVHEARKATKKSRAVLRLVRDDLDSKTFKRENRALRDAARKLSEPRDAVVLVATVERLAQQVPLARRSLMPLKTVLDERRRDATTRVLDDDGAMEAAAHELAEIRERLGALEMETDGFAALEGGLRRTYAEGREAFADARKKPTDQRLHDARKRVKDLWYHARLLRPVWPGPIGELVDALDRLGDLLGEDHDLAVLAKTVAALADEGAGGGAGETVLSLAANRRAELQAEIWPLGRRVYADRLKPFVRRLGVLYRTWREETVWSLSAESAEIVRGLLEAKRSGTTLDWKRHRERLRRRGVRLTDVESHVPELGNGDVAPADFDRLVEQGRVRIAEPVR
jgi:CHAD domain-containing protein